MWLCLVHYLSFFTGFASRRNMAERTRTDDIVKLNGSVQEESPAELLRALRWNKLVAKCAPRWHTKERICWIAHYRLQFASSENRVSSTVMLDSTWLVCSGTWIHVDWIQLYGLVKYFKQLFPSNKIHEFAQIVESAVAFFNTDWLCLELIRLLCFCQVGHVAGFRTAFLSAGF